MGTIWRLAVPSRWLSTMERDGTRGVRIERRIAFEVAMDLRILPKFTDDGAPEGTVERPLSTLAVPEVVLSPDGVSPQVAPLDFEREQPARERSRNSLLNAR